VLETTPASQFLWRGLQKHLEEYRQRLQATLRKSKYCISYTHSRLIMIVAKVLYSVQATPTCTIHEISGRHFDWYGEANVILCLMLRLTVIILQHIG